MITASIAFFALAAILGILLLAFVLREKHTPKGVLFLHGGMAATGLVLLLIYSFGHSPRPWKASSYLFWPRRADS